MIELIKRDNKGFEMFTVVWELGQIPGIWETKDFWSEIFAREFIARKFPHIDLNTIKTKGIR